VAVAAVLCCGLMLAPAAAAADPDLGANVIIFDPTMDVADIQATADAIYAQQVDDEMGTNRYALLFKPGTYGSASQPLQIKVGYYTEIAGLGESPSEVHIVGKVEVYNRCLDDGGTSNCHALNNFWRSMSNLSIEINGAGQDGCRSSANFWAVSQAAPLRRVAISGGNLSLMDYCSAGPQYASGGFIADSDLPFVINGSQQQFLVRNSDTDGWSNAVWNQVFAGVNGAPSEADFPNPPYTTLTTTPASREKPYLYVDGDGNYFVRVPEARADSVGTSWDGGPGAGRSIPINKFYVATPSSSAKEINRQLAKGKNLLLTPGVYTIDRKIQVTRPNTVVLGLGLATLTSSNGVVPLNVADGDGVMVAGLIIDAGEEKSANLLRVGGPHRTRGYVGTGNPTTLSDVFLRVGGPHIGRTKVALQVNKDNVILDDVWVWRADHGVEGFSGDTERWNTNLGRNGMVVTGRNVTATGLFVEHFQQFNTIWNGENGTTIMYQSELAYDPPTQESWMNGNTQGWAGYKVDRRVTTHSLYGAGVYVFNQNNPSIHTYTGFEVPETPGVALHHIMTVNLSAGTLDHVVNDVGDAADTTRVGAPVTVTDYP
jgi:hypothetical protein